MSEHSFSIIGYKDFSKQIKPFIFHFSGLKQTCTWDVKHIGQGEEPDIQLRRWEAEDSGTWTQTMSNCQEDQESFTDSNKERVQTQM